MPDSLKYRLIIFDFDGTLADTFPFFTRIFNELARHYRFNTIEAHEVEMLRQSSARQVMQYVGLPRWKLPFVARRFMQQLSLQSDQVLLFAQIEENLQLLAAAGVRLAIVSSNSRANISRILGNERLEMFEQVQGGMSIFGKAAHLKKLLKKTGVKAEQAIYIGDQDTDAMAAAQAKMDFGAVSWGFGRLEALRRHPVAIELKQVDDLRHLLAPCPDQAGTGL